MSYLKQLSNQIQNYYDKNFCLDLHYFPRPYLMGFCLLFVRMVWYVLLILTSTMEEKVSFIDGNLKNVDNINIFNYVEGYSNVPINICFGFNVFLLILLGLNICAHSYGYTASQLKILLSFLCQLYNYILFVPIINICTYELQTNPIASTNLGISIFISLAIRIHDQDFSYGGEDFLGKKNPFVWDFVQVYLETLFVILKQYVSDPILVCIFNLFLSIYTLIDSITNQSYNKSSMRFYYLFFSLYHTLLVSDILCSIIIHKKHPLSFTILFLLPVSYKISQLIFKQTNDLSIIYKNILLNGEKMSLKRIQTLDFFLRNLYENIKISFEDFRVSKNSIILEKLFSDHKINCQEIDCIFCNYQIDSQEQFEQNFLDGKERNCFLKRFIRGQYMAVISSSSLKKNSLGRTQFLFSYFHYLIEVEKTKVLGYVEMIRWKKTLKLSARESAMLNRIFSEAKIQFETNRSQFTQTLQSNKISGSTVLNNNNQQYEDSLQKQESGQHLGNQSVEHINFFIGILYDEELNRVEKNYFESLAMKLKVLDILSGDHIDLIEFKRFAIQLKKLIDKLRSDLQSLGQIHFNSHKVQYYMEGFALHLGFGDKKRRIFKKKSNRRADKYTSKFTSIENSIFEKDNCVLFMSLIQSSIGIVKRVQNKFENLFGIPIKDIIGKSINVIMPQLIAKHHDKMISLYIQNSSSYEMQQSSETYKDINQVIEKSNQSEYTSKESKKPLKDNHINNSNKQINQKQYSLKKIISANNYFKLLIARNSEGWGVPISLQFKVDCIGQSDCGITAHIKNVQSDYYYFMTNPRHFQTQLITHNAYERLFSRFLPKNEVQSIYLNRMIPLLHYFEKLWVQENEKQEEVHRDLVKTVAFLPKQQNLTEQQQNQNLLYTKRPQTSISPLFQKLEYQNLSQEIQKYRIEQYDMFIIKMKFYHYKNSFLSYNIVEVQQIRRVVSTQSQRESLLLLKSQLHALMNINYDIKKDLELLQKIEQLAGFNQDDSQNNFQVNMSMQIDENISQISEERIDQYINQSQEIQYSRRQGSREYNQINGVIQRTQLVDNLINLKSANAGNTNNGSNIISKSQKQEQNSIVSHLNNFSNQVQDNQSIFNQQNYNNNNNQNSLLGNSMMQTQTGRYNEEDNIQYSNRNPLGQSNEKNYISRQISDQGTYPEYNSYLQVLQFQRFDENASTQIQSNLQATDRNSKQDIHSTLVDALRDNPSSRRQLYPLEEEEVENNQINYTKAKLDSERQNIQSPQPQQKGLYELLNDNKGNNKKIATKSGNDNFLYNYPSNASGLELGSYAQMSQMNSLNQINSQNNNAIQNNILDNIQGVSPILKQSSNSKQLQFLTSYYKTQPHSSKQQELQKTQGKKKIQLEEEDVNLYGMRKDKDGYSSDFMSNSAQRDEDRIRKEQEERSRILDASSVKTSQSNNHEHKKNIQRLVRSDQKDISIIILNIFGYLAILTIAIITIYEFFQIEQKLVQSKEDIILIPWANTMRVSFSNAIAYNSLADLIEFNGFKDASLYDKQYIKDLRQRTLNDQLENKLLIRDYTISDISTKPYFQYINTNIMNYIYNIDDKTTPKADLLKNVAAYKISKNMTTQYFLQHMVVYNYLYAAQDTSVYEDVYYQKQQIDNFINFSLNMTYVQNEIQLESKNILHSVESQQLDLMTLILIVSFILIAALFPLYYFVQYKNQILLKLFATIPSLSLSAMVRSIQLAIDFQNDGKLSKTKFAILARADNLKKRKNISTTSSLPKFKLSLCIFCLFAFILIIIQPIVNYILVSQFNSEVQTNIDLLGSLYNLRAQIGSNLAVNYKYLVYKLTPQKQVYNPSYYAARLKSFSTSNSAAANNVTNVINNSQNQKKKQQAIYDNFFYKIVNENLCDALKNYPQYIAEENQIDLSACSTIQSGILTKGFQISIKRFFEIWADVYQIFQLKDQQQVIDNLVLWQQGVKLREFDTYQQDLINVLKIIKDFLINTMKTDLDDILNIQIILLSFQIILLIVFFSIGWHTFLKFVYNEMIEIKQLLSIIQIDFIVDNPYIISYLTK